MTCACECPGSCDCGKTYIPFQLTTDILNQIAAQLPGGVANVECFQAAAPAADVPYDLDLLSDDVSGTVETSGSWIYTPAADVTVTRISQLQTLALLAPTFTRRLLIKTGGINGTIVGTSDDLTYTATSGVRSYIFSTPVTLTAGTAYHVVHAETDNTTSVNINGDSIVRTVGTSDVNGEVTQGSVGAPFKVMVQVVGTTPGAPGGTLTTYSVVTADDGTQTVWDLSGATPVEAAALPAGATPCLEEGSHAINVECFEISGAGSTPYEKSIRDSQDFQVNRPGWIYTPTADTVVNEIEQLHFAETAPATRRLVIRTGAIDGPIVGSSDDITSSTVKEWRAYTFSTPVTLTTGQNYYVVYADDTDAPVDIATVGGHLDVSDDTSDVDLELEIQAIEPSSIGPYVAVSITGERGGAATAATYSVVTASDGTQTVWDLSGATPVGIAALPAGATPCITPETPHSINVECFETPGDSTPTAYTTDTTNDVDSGADDTSAQWIYMPAADVTVQQITQIQRALGGAVIPPVNRVLEIRSGSATGPVVATSDALNYVPVGGPQTYTFSAPPALLAGQAVWISHVDTATGDLAINTLGDGLARTDGASDINGEVMTTGGTPAKVMVTVIGEVATTTPGATYSVVTASDGTQTVWDLSGATPAELSALPAGATPCETAPDIPAQEPDTQVSIECFEVSPDGPYDLDLTNDLGAGTSEESGAWIYTPSADIAVDEITQVQTAATTPFAAIRKLIIKTGGIDGTVVAESTTKTYGATGGPQTYLFPGVPVLTTGTAYHIVFADASGNTVTTPDGDSVQRTDGPSDADNEVSANSAGTPDKVLVQVVGTIVGGGVADKYNVVTNSDGTQTVWDLSGGTPVEIPAIPEGATECTAGFIVNAGPTADAADNTNGEANIVHGDTLHFVSNEVTVADGSVIVDLTPLENCAFPVERVVFDPVVGADLVVFPPTPIIRVGSQPVDPQIIQDWIDANVDYNAATTVSPDISRIDDMFGNTTEGGFKEFWVWTEAPANLEWTSTSEGFLRVEVAALGSCPGAAASFTSVGEDQGGLVPGFPGLISTTVPAGFSRLRITFVDMGGGANTWTYNGDAVDFYSVAETPDPTLQKLYVDCDENLTTDGTTPFTGISLLISEWPCPFGLKVNASDIVGQITAVVDEGVATYAYLPVDSLTFPGDTGEVTVNGLTPGITVRIDYNGMGWSADAAGFGVSITALDAADTALAGDLTGAASAADRTEPWLNFSNIPTTVRQAFRQLTIPVVTVPADGTLKIRLNGSGSVRDGEGSIAITPIGGQ